MKTKVKDIFKDHLELEAVEGRLAVSAIQIQAEKSMGFLFDKEQVIQLRDALNEFLGESTLRPISFGGGGNTVIVMNDQVSQFSSTEADALKKLVSGIVEKF